MLTFELSSLTCYKCLFLASHLFYTLRDKSKAKHKGERGYFFACGVLSPHEKMLAPIYDPSPSFFYFEANLSARQALVSTANES